MERILVDSLEGYKGRCPKCDEEFKGYFEATPYYISLLACIQKLVGIGPDAGEQLDYEVLIEYPGED